MRVWTGSIWWCSVLLRFSEESGIVWDTYESRSNRYEMPNINGLLISRVVVHAFSRFDRSVGLYASNDKKNIC